MQVFRIILSGNGRPGKDIALFGVIADLKFANDVLIEAAFFEVAEADVLSLFRIEQGFGEEFLGEAVDDIEAVGGLLLQA